MTKKSIKKIKKKFLNFTENLLFDLGEFLDRFFIPPVTYEKIRNYELWKLKQKEKEEFQEKKARAKIRRAFYEFRRRGYIENQRLTPKGIVKLLRIKIKFLKEKKKWDGYWRVVIFDIPERKRKARDLFRRALKEFGFRQVQKSIWICPYDYFKDIRMLAKNLFLEPFVIFMLVEKIDFSEKWKKLFEI